MASPAVYSAYTVRFRATAASHSSLRANSFDAGDSHSPTKTFGGKCLNDFCLCCIPCRAVPCRAMRDEPRLSFRFLTVLRNFVIAYPRWENTRNG